MAKTKAAVCRTFGEPFEIETVTLRAPRKAELLVTLEACAICHSDISYSEGIWGGILPAIYGHEAVGRVRDAGPDAGVEVGTRVLVTLLRACGSCSQCTTGHPATCTSPEGSVDAITSATGEPIFQAMYTGGFAEEVLVHKSQIIEISEAIPAASASLLSCGVITGVGAVVNAAQMRPGEDVVVIGAGGVGLNTIQGARIAGARRIVAVDLSDEKLDAAKAFGATDVVRADQDAPWTAAIEAMGRGADCVFVTVGITPVYAAATNYLGPRGRVIAVGMPPSDQTSPYSPDMLAANGQVIVGSKMGDVVLGRDIPWLVDLYEQGRLELDALVSRTYPLDQINAAIADVKSGAARRNVIVFD